MGTPGGRASHRAGRHFEEELSLKYLSPGAFTVLTPEQYGYPPDPPSAPTQYRLLTPNTRRRREQAFSIIAEATSNPGSRSPSPTGRVSPFRGRGFNPIGSRHASPNPSPPPEDIRTLSRTNSKQKIVQSAKKSQIPQPTRKGNGRLFGDKVTKSPKFRRKNGSKLSPHLSKSLTNISPKNVSVKPPRSPNRHKKFSKKPAFEQLSPITGSSPETDSKENKSQSSPSKIPRSSKSQPVSRKSSPTRTLSPTSKQSSINNSRVGSKNSSRNTSRDPSPSKGQTKIPVKNSPTKTSSNKSKPKVPPKPQDISAKSGDRTKPGSSKLIRKESLSQIKTSKTKDSKIKNGKKSDKMRDKNNREEEQNVDNDDKNEKLNISPDDNTKDEDVAEIKKTESSGRLSDIASATTVVSSTTTTATQPLKIETHIENILKEEFNKSKATPTKNGDDQVLNSANSVSSAMSKMNDTVLNSQTLLKDHNFVKMSPAASAIISLSTDSSRENKALDTKSATTALPTIESITKKLDDGSQNINNTFVNSNKVHMESIENTVKNNINKITPDHKLGISGSYVQKSANERIREARTVVAADVKPIKILVKEKPTDIEVQSGNVRIPANATNGLNVIPGLPPPQQPDNVSPNQEREESKRGCCSRFFRCCRCTSSKFCKTNRKTRQKQTKNSKGCCGFRKKKHEAEEIVTSSTNLAEQVQKKVRCWDRLKCCKSKKVGDNGCCPRGKRKNSWVDRKQENFTNETTRPTGCKNRCKSFIKKLFCCSACCHCCKSKDVEDPISRRESMLSKKKSLTPTVAPVDVKPKIDQSLVEHLSVMRGAIPVLPVPLAWVCLIFNTFLPGIGTILSGMFCLCLGKPRFSQNDGPRPRLGAFLIDFIIGCGQLFTVLFCLVGWGWSIWWGVIMLKIARKNKRIRMVEERAQDRPVPVVNENHHTRDPERGS